MLLDVLVLCGGLALLTYGADRFVEGAAAAAANLGVPSLLVGLVIVGFATSAPEMLVAAVAAFDGAPTLGIGNAIGSNITNIGLVLGASALIAPMNVGSGLLRRESPMLFAVLVFATALLADGYLSRLDGTLLVAGMFVVIGAMVWLGRHTAPGDPIVAEVDHELAALAPPMSTARALAWLALGLALLLGGSRLVVSGAVAIAQGFGLSDVVIGLTVVAVGTSLPELAASVAGALKNEPDIAIGNVLGSNMFNALGVLGLPGLIAPSGFEAEVIIRDLPCMFLLSLALLMMCRARGGRRRIGRRDGGLLLAAFCGYQLLLFGTR
ncbi:MAG: calcium/sodium antiporter [Gammaproteobacteria bacterium]|nr:calcium/sodium antiporter [Gammaproteobacteria bacterium]